MAGTPVTSLALTAAAVGMPLFAGGWFVLSLGQPAVHPDIRAHDSGLVVRVYGCSAKMAALHVVAEGVISGQRRSIPVKPVALQGRDNGADPWSSTDFAIPRSWPTE